MQNRTYRLLSYRCHQLKYFVYRDPACSMSSHQYVTADPETTHLNTRNTTKIGILISNLQSIYYLFLEFGQT